MSFLQEVEKRLDLPRGEKARVMAELESHWTEVRDELIASGMVSPEAEQEAAHRLGEPSDIAARLNAVHNSASWKSALMTIAPMLGTIVVFDCSYFCWSKSLALSTTAYLVVAALTGFAILKTHREMKAGRQPVWLPTWLAASIVCGHWLLKGIARRMQLEIAGPECSPLGLYLGITAAIVVVFALVTCWDSPKWRKAAGLGSALMILGTVAIVQLRLPGWTWGHTALSGFERIVNFALWLAIALRIFARDRFRSALPASLFLYTYFTIGWWHTAFPGGPWLYWVYPHTLAAAIVVLLFVRSPLQWQKTAALVGGVITMYGAWSLYRELFLWNGAVSSSGVSTLPFSFVSASLSLLLMVAAVTAPLLIAGQDSQPRGRIAR